MKLAIFLIALVAILVWKSGGAKTVSTWWQNRQTNTPQPPASGSGQKFSFRKFWGQWAWIFWGLFLLVIFWQFLPEEMSKDIMGWIVGLLGPNWVVKIAIAIGVVGLLWAISFTRGILSGSLYILVIGGTLLFLVITGKNLLCSSAGGDAGNCDQTGVFKTQADMPGYTLVESDCTPYNTYVGYGIEDGQFWAAAKPYEVWQNGKCLVKCDGVTVQNLGTIQPGYVTIKSKRGAILVQLWVKYRQE